MVKDEIIISNIYIFLKIDPEMTGFFVFSMLTTFFILLKIRGT